MKINEELLKKHFVMLPEAYKIFHPNITNVEEDVYRTFLSNTDKIVMEIFEEFVEVASSADSATEFLNVMFRFLKNIRTEHKEVLEARSVAKIELNKMEQGEAPNE